MADTTNSGPFDDRDQPGDVDGQSSDDRPSNLNKDPDQWSTGDESMTDAQRSYLKTLSDEAGEEWPGELSKAEASKRIDALQQRTGRGINR